MWPAQKENGLGYERTGLEICRGEEVDNVSNGVQRKSGMPVGHAISEDRGRREHGCGVSNRSE